MDRKNINRGFKKLRVWQDAVSLHVLACNIFVNFPFELKKVAANSVDAAHSISRNISEGYCRRSLKEYLNHLNIAHSCKSRFCPTCGKHATDVWADQVLNGLLDVAYHHLIMAIPWQLRIVIMMNRRAGLNLITQAATEANTHQSWAQRQAEFTGIDPLLCPICDQPLTFAGMLFGNWQKRQDIFDTAGKDASIAPPLLKPG